MEDRWDCMSVVCIKEYKTLKVGSHYDIKGRGNLEFNADPEAQGKTGYGLCVEDDLIGYGMEKWWKLPYEKRIKWYYFTIDEMDEYFITDEEGYKLHLQKEQRDDKLNELGI
jgi:hypothetical protein